MFLLTKADTRPNYLESCILRMLFKWALPLIITLMAAMLPAMAAPTHIQILPGSLTLNGARDTRRLIVEVLDASGRAIGDRTKAAKVSIDHPAVVVAGKDGILHPRHNGTAIVTASINGSTASIRVNVCGMTTPHAPGFRNEVIPVLTSGACNSGSCHGAAAGKGGLRLSLRGYDPDADFAVLTHQANGRRVQPGVPDESLILLKPTMRVGHGGGQRISIGSEEEAVVAAWIKAGAPPPSSDDRQIQSVDVTPATVFLKPGDQQHVVVTARYSDGTTRDVTPLARFGTVDTTVAAVGPDGEVKVAGRGETAITVWYSSKVTYARVVVPFPGSSAHTASTPTSASIDRLINLKLRELNLPSSPQCNDGEFIRRVSLDVAGILPTPEETDQFLADNASDKRARYIDHLMKRPEFIDYWTYKWSDLLLLNSKGISGESLSSFYKFIRDSVAANKPWNQFVREIITARGSTLDNGAATFFVLHKDPFDLTETTTQAFMGLSLMCAHCHNHPMEKWTQKDYYQMANLYSRVRLKVGDKAGEVLVLASSSGDIPHPRLGTALSPKPLDSPELRADDNADRRIKLADWLTGPNNHAFARSVINRVWRSLMGKGLVEAEDDLRATNPPSNEPLMAALEQDFVKNGYDVRGLIRNIVSSEAYQRTSSPVGANATDHRYYSHYIIRRLPAEPLLDAISTVTAVPTEFKDIPKSTRALQLKDSQVASYFLTAFGRPAREKTCSCERQSDANIAQALHLSNGDTINTRLQMKDGAVDRLLKAGASDKQIVDHLYLAALCRYPSLTESAADIRELTSAQNDIALRRQIVEDIFWAVLSSREFLFNH